jgi:hypothetical protein
MSYMDKKRKVTDISKENDKAFVQDGMTTDEVRNTVKHIRAYIEKGGNVSIEDRIKQLQTEHAFFAERYPMLFDLCTRQEFNLEHLNYFLKMRDEIINDKISTEDASKAVGQQWFNKFVDVSKIPPKKDKK